MDAFGAQGGIYMAEMGYGYGSEFQLLRFLGHHRKQLNEIITTQIPENIVIEWMDYPSDKNRISLDSEFKGINFLDTKLQDELKNDWSKYWTGNTQSWDGLFYSNKKVFIVEAKAHLDEIKSKFESKDEKNLNKIKDAMYATQAAMKIVKSEKWIGQYYQLANRLAFLNFLRSHNIESHLVYIYFLNGYRKRDFKGNEIENKNVQSVIDWKKEINKQYIELGIDKINIEDYIYKVFIDCE